MVLRRLKTLKEEAEASRFDFVLLELDLALTFCWLAGNTSDQIKAERNLQSAEKAFLSAKHFLEDGTVGGARKKPIEERMDHLRRCLEEGRGRRLEQLPLSQRSSPLRRS